MPPPRSVAAVRLAADPAGQQHDQRDENDDASIELPITTAKGRGTYLYVIDGEVAMELDADSAGGAGLTRERLATGDALVLEGPEQGRIVGGLPTSELWCADVPLAFTPHGVWAR